ncbi:MAG: DUF1801 domain-containing protein [Tannerellaceae bacterium]|jgi:uncharacterized protein YdhG (YjbR/CyaY superfamily)|nr:DUF1801 domain-containing protein [Tannerellaceae bacterium]
MWKCEKCGREFKNTNQDHYCGKFSTIDEYISVQDPEIQPVLHKVRRVIRENAPHATEKISWRMPTFWEGENIIHFAAFKKHLGIYPGDLTLSPFIEKLDGYKHTKGAIQFPYDKPIDYNLIAEIVRYRIENKVRR